MVRKVIKSECLDKVELEPYDDGIRLALRKVRLTYDVGEPDTGYQFVWLTEKGKQIPRRGQTLLTGADDIQALLDKGKNKSGYFE